MESTDINFIVGPVLLIIGVSISLFTIGFLILLKKQVDKMTDSRKKEVLNRIISLAGQKVLAMEQTAVMEVKDRLKAGEIKREDLPALMKEIKQKTIGEVKMDAMILGIWDETIKVFQGSGLQSEKWLSEIIEGQVYQLPPSGVQTPNAEPPKSDA